jgi:hypothetical protein
MPKSSARSVATTTSYDDLTLDIERVDVLVDHRNALSILAEKIYTPNASNKLYALALRAGVVCAPQNSPRESGGVSHRARWAMMEGRMENRLVVACMALVLLLGPASMPLAPAWASPDAWRRPARIESTSGSQLR